VGFGSVLEACRHQGVAHTYSHLYGLPATGLRFFTVYGPWGRPEMAPMLFARAIVAGEPIKVFNGGQMQRDFTHIDDIAEGVIRCLDKPATANPDFDPLHPDPAIAAVPHRLFNIGNSQPMQPGDVLATALPVDDAAAHLGDVVDLADEVAVEGIEAQVLRPVLFIGMA
jgi:nucleoside-diphosphate-sugar epimerase